MKKACKTAIFSILTLSLSVPFVSGIFSNLRVDSYKAHAEEASAYDYTKCNVNIPTGYYSSLDLNDTKENFKNKLSSIISNNAVKFSYSYVGDTILNISDMDPEHPDNIKCFYTNQSLTGGWNREHIWCKSHGFTNQTNDSPYTDAHHLRATNATANSTRNNSDYGEVDHNTSYQDIFGNYYTGDTYEPRDEIKGDCARMIFYMAIRYKNDAKYQAELINGSSMSYLVDGGKMIFGNLPTLLKWHYQDPVSVEELYRNNVVYSFQ